MHDSIVTHDIPLCSDKDGWAIYTMRLIDLLNIFPSIGAHPDKDDLSNNFYESDVTRKMYVSILGIIYPITDIKYYPNWDKQLQAIIFEIAPEVLEAYPDGVGEQEVPNEAINYIKQQEL